MRAGLDPDGFWRLTPREIAARITASRQRDVDRYNDAMTVAYSAAVVPHMKRPPRLKELLRDPEARPRRRQTPEEMKAMLMLALPRRG